MARASASSGNFASTLWRRGREERLPQAAGGLAFATAVSMVPLLAVSFALFARLPALRTTGDAIRDHLLRGLLPADIARTVLAHMAQFTGNANGLTLVGFAALLVSALALLVGVENTLNRIWQVKKPRPLAARLALHATLLLAAPLALGASVWATSSLLAASAALQDKPQWLTQALRWGPVLLASCGFTCLYRYVPHTEVRWRNALAGGLLAGLAFEAGKRGFAFYLARVPTYRTLYGAFAPLLVFLMWVYCSWFITLAGALVSATLPRGGGAPRRRAARA